MAQLTYFQAAGALAGLYLLYGLALIVYRLYLHPLAKFPGPRLAAATSWYEVYYDVYLSGKFRNKIKDMHSQYGTYHNCASLRFSETESRARSDCAIYPEPAQHSGPQLL